MLEEYKNGTFSSSHKLEIFPLEKIYNSRITKNPTILGNEGSPADLGPQFSPLCSVLENITGANLPRTPSPNSEY